MGLNKALTRFNCVAEMICNTLVLLSAELLSMCVLVMVKVAYQFSHHQQRPQIMDVHVNYDTALTVFC